MPSFEMNRLQSITGISPTSPAERAKNSTAGSAEPRAGPISEPVSRPGSGATSGIAVEISGTANSSRVESGPPVDSDRIAEIRNALREGTYPLVPAKIADAMIAAQLKFEIEE